MDAKADHQPTDSPSAEGSALKSFVVVALIALVVCGALVGGAIYYLDGSSQLPFNYQGFDNK